MGSEMYMSTQITKLGYLLWFLVKEERKQDKFNVEFEIIQEGATQINPWASSFTRSRIQK